MKSRQSKEVKGKELCEVLRGQEKVLVGEKMLFLIWRLTTYGLLLCLNQVSIKKKASCPALVVNTTE